MSNPVTEVGKAIVAQLNAVFGVSFCDRQFVPRDQLIALTQRRISVITPESTWQRESRNSFEQSVRAEICVRRIVDAANLDSIDAELEIVDQIATQLTEVFRPPTYTNAVLNEIGVAPVFEFQRLKDTSVFFSVIAATYSVSRS